MIAITKKYEVSMAHRLEGHEKCGRLHGHNYEVTVILTQENYFDEKWVMDYAQLDSITKPILDEMDHRYLISFENTEAECPYAAIALQRKEAFLLPRKSSTSELIADYLLAEVKQALNVIGRHEIIPTISIKESYRTSAAVTEQ